MHVRAVGGGERAEENHPVGGPKAAGVGAHTTQVCVTYTCGFLLRDGRHGSYPHFCLSSFLSSVGQKRDRDL